MRAFPVRAALLAMIVALPLPALAQVDEEGPIRKGLWDFSVVTGWNTFNTAEFNLPGAKVDLDIDDSPFIGLRGEGHFTENVGFAMGFTFTRPNYTSTVKAPGFGTIRAGGDVAINWIDADLTWRIVKKRHTPYVLGGIAAFNGAFKKIDPDTFVEEYRWEWHAAAGYEWHLREHLLVNVGVRARLTEFANQSNNLVALQGVVGLGYRSGPPKNSW